MKIVVTGSIAYDYLMSFPGKFTEHFLPDHMNRVSLSFLVDTMDKRRGGCAPNIAYTLALLGERPLLMATAGEDFGDTALAGGGRRRHVARHADRRQVHGVLLLQHRRRQQPDRVVLHRGDGRRRPAVVPRPRATAAWRSSRRTIPGRWSSTPRNAATLGIPFIFDPGQQCARMSGDELGDGVIGATIVICNDYEFELIARRPALSEADILKKSRSADRHARRERVLGPHARRAASTCLPLTPHRIVDPTGVGDASAAG